MMGELFESLPLHKINGGIMALISFTFLDTEIKTITMSSFFFLSKSSLNKSTNHV